MRTLYRTISAAVMLTAVMLGAAVPPASAQVEEVDRGQCVADGETLFATVYHTPFPDGTTYVDRVSFNIDGQHATQNNVNLKIRGDAGAVTYWAFTSGDDIHGEQTYNFTVNQVVPRAANPYLEVWTLLDQGVDSSCAFNVYLY